MCTPRPLPLSGHRSCLCTRAHTSLTHAHTTRARARTHEATAAVIINHRRRGATKVAIADGLSKTVTMDNKNGAATRPASAQGNVGEGHRFSERDYNTYSRVRLSVVVLLWPPKMRDFTTRLSRMCAVDPCVLCFGVSCQRLGFSSGKAAQRLLQVRMQRPPRATSTRHATSACRCTTD